MSQSVEDNLGWMFPDQMPGSGRSLQTRAIVAVICLVVLPTSICGWLLMRQSNRALEDDLIRDSAMLAETAAHLVAAHYDGESLSVESLRVALDEAIVDERIAFFVVTDLQGRALDARYNEPLAYHLYQTRLTPQERLGSELLNRSIRVPDLNDESIVFRRQSIKSTVHSSGAGAGRLIGYLELGLHDPDQEAALKGLKDMAIVLVASICLVMVPFAVLWVNLWMRPLRRMLQNTLRMTMGGQFVPIETKRKDEIGLLSRSFNTMASNLTMVQAALIESNAMLERKVASRTEELNAANDRLRREMNDKDQFLRAVTHDLGAPIRNISGIVQRLLAKHRKDFDEDVLAKLERIAVNARAESELVSDLLELSRLGRPGGKRVAVDLNEVVSQIGEQFYCDLEERNIELLIDRHLPEVMCDRNRMRQVLQNLIENAKKYMPDDTAERKIHVGWKLLNGDRVGYVRDTGSGIDKKDHGLIFEVFQRARYSGEQQAAGRGVGLAGVKAIVEAYGGEVWVESEPPNGATFFFTLPEGHPSRAAADQVVAASA